MNGPKSKRGRTSSSLRSIWLLTKRELRTMLVRKSFWLTTLLLPAVVVLLVLIPQFSSLGQTERQDIASADNGKPIGFVEKGGVLGAAQSGLTPGVARQYLNEPAAKLALEAGEIDRYYIIPADYVESGRLTVVQARFAPLQALSDQTVIRYVLDTGLTGSASTAALLLDPTPQLATKALSPEASSGGKPGDSLLGYVFMFIFYLSLILTSSFVLQSVSREKESRTAEVLLASMKARDMMLGKVMGLSGVAFIQVAIWLGIGYAAFGRGANLAGVSLDLSEVSAAHLLPWALAYFLVGYLMYASAYAVLAALARTAREATQFVFVAIVPLLIPLFLYSAISEAPNGTLAKVLSLFPLTSPVSMAPRLAGGVVPWWQSLTGLVALGIFAYLLVLLAGRIFRADNLLSYRALSLGRIIQEVHTKPVAQAATGTAAMGSGNAPSGGSSSLGRRGAASKKAAQTAVASAFLILFGGIEIARGELFAIAILAIGVGFAALAYWRYRSR
jgi:ABC-2 type transport system permease protein